MDANAPLKITHDVSQNLQRKLEGLADVERAFVHVDYEHLHDIGVSSVSSLPFPCPNPLPLRHVTLEAMWLRICLTHTTGGAQASLPATQEETQPEGGSARVPEEHQGPDRSIRPGDGRSGRQRWVAGAPGMRSWEILSRLHQQKRRG